MRTFLILLSLIVCSAAHGAAAPTSPPEKVVSDFYAANARFPPITNPQQAEPFVAFLSRGLYRSMKSALEADEIYLRKNPSDKGFFGDGVSFVGSPDGYTSYLVKSIILNGPNAAKVAVQFSYIDRRKPKEWSDTWTNVLFLIREKNRWVIDDIEYRDGGKLSFDLKMAEEDAHSASQN